MIEQDLDCLADELDSHLSSVLMTTEKTVALSGLVNPDRSLSPATENKTVITLINLQKEPSSQINLGPRPASPPATTNWLQNAKIHLLLSSNCTNYTEGLKILSIALSYLQDKSVFTATNTPGLPSGIERITIEQENLSFQELSNIWTMLGAKYVPSVVYKVTVLPTSGAL